MLVVTVTILLTLVAKIFTPMREFLQAYMGDYVECLLETGELPTLGGESRTLDPDSCDSKFKEATLAGGRGKKADAEEAAKEAREKAARDAGAGGGGGGTYAGSSSRHSKLFSDSFNRKSSEGTNKDSKIVEISIAATEEGGFRKSSGTFSSFVTRKDYGQTVTYGLSASEQENLEKEKKGASRVIAGEALTALPKKRLIRPPAASKVKEIEAPSLGIGDYLRYILIGAIIIVLGLLIGGQAAKLAKGWEK